MLAKIDMKIDERVKEGGIETTGITYGEGKRMINIKYYVDGKEYSSAVGKGFSYIHDGEAFLIKYLPADPTSIVVFLDKPILLEQYKYSETACTYLDKTLSVIRFMYMVNNEIIKRETLYTSNQSLNPEDYVVMYRTENPTIGYLIRKQ